MFCHADSVPGALRADEIEHYACCPFFWRSLPRWAGISAEPCSFRRFLLLDLQPGDHPARPALVVYVAYGAFNLARAQNRRLDDASLRLMILERFRTAVQLSRPLCRLLRPPRRH